MKIFFRLLAFGALATTAASCGRATYSFNTNAPAYLGTARASQPIAPVATTPAAVASSRPAAVAEETVVPLATVKRASGPAVAAPKPDRAEASATKVPAAQESMLATTIGSASAVAQSATAAPARPTRLSWGQRLLVKGLMAGQLHKIKAARQNLARVHETQAVSKAGRAALIALIGAVLVALVIAVAQNGGGDATFFVLVGIIGYALLITGIVLLVIALVNG